MIMWDRPLQGWAKIKWSNVLIQSSTVTTLQKPLPRYDTAAKLAKQMQCKVQQWPDLSSRLMFSASSSGGAVCSVWSRLPTEHDDRREGHTASSQPKTGWARCRGAQTLMNPCWAAERSLNSHGSLCSWALSIPKEGAMRSISCFL
jgi:hypothetical protein